MRSKKLIIANPSTISEEDFKEIVPYIKECLIEKKESLRGRVVSSNCRELRKYVLAMSGVLGYSSNHVISKTEKDDVADFLSRISTNIDGIRREFTSDHDRVVGIVHFEEPEIMKIFKTLGVSNPIKDTSTKCTFYYGDV